MLNRRLGVSLLLVLLHGCSSSPTADFVVAPPVGRPEGIVIGTNYTHAAFDGCGFTGAGLLMNYHEGGVRARAQRQLARMRRRGIESLRLIIWHMHDPDRHEWGVVGSRGGRLDPQVRANLINLLNDVAAARFYRLTVAFSPQWSNSPLRENYDAGRFEENLDFIVAVRALVRRSSVTSTRFDLLNEGAPSAHLHPRIFEQLMEYDRRIWEAYVSRFGPQDATISAIGKKTPGDDGERLENLITGLRKAGSQDPGFLDVHLNGDAGEVRAGLASVAATLDELGLKSKELVIGETAYDDAGVAAEVAEAARSAQVPIGEVTQFFQTADGDCNVEPPYSADAFVDALP